MLFRKARKRQKKSFSRSQMIQNRIFWTQTFFQNLTCQKVFNSDSNALYFLQSKFWRVVKLSNQNLTRCLFFFNIWRVVNFFIQNLLFKSTFQILAELLSKCYQHQKTTCWIMTTSWGKKKVFYECVAYVCLTFGTIFLVIAFFMALGCLMRVMTLPFAVSIDLYKSLWNSENR